MNTMNSEDKILIIDDDERNIFALSAVLKAKGYHCLTASEAEKGIALLQDDEQISVVLLDMMMPNIDGYEALKIIRSHEKLNRLPVVAITAQAMVGDKEKCLQAGANDYISKPVDVDKLLNILEKYINR
jgi:CheY-like chemotaxis protein